VLPGLAEDLESSDFGQISVQQPHTGLLWSHNKPGLNTFQTVFIPPQGRWFAVQEAPDFDERWRAEVPDKLHHSLT